ncbi:aminotransferase class I/II-fold pyridoxal phosphate-dependent enzyme [Janibacter melonis]|uniref:MalY/PatB family protein n=1 Tax=Janibacter melonis TaxID=262209 RepID=UPI00177DB114|nr:aminotransferase class I/II-fold pyridoxal phosphate-dependent enzyme [Janibacter melonis]
MARSVLDVPLRTLRARTSAKWRAYDTDVLPLWVAEMDVMPAPAVVRALARVAETGDHGYPWGPAYPEAVARWYDRSFGVAVDPGASQLVADVMTGVAHALRAVTAPGAAVVITTPVYPPFHSVVGDVGARRVEAPLDAHGRLDLETVRAALVEGGPGSSVLLSNPHNPTGVVHSPAELEALLALAAEHDGHVVSDEIHAPLVLPGAGFTSVLAVPGGSRALVVTSAAKGWNLAGYKAAVLVAGEDVRDVLRRLPASAGYQASHVAVLAHVAALDDGQDWLAALVADLDANRTLLGDLLAQHLPQVTWRPMEATYLAWLDCSALGWPDPSRVFLEQGRVALNRGRDFGRGSADHVRLNLATSPEVLVEAVERMGRAAAPAG